LTLLPERLKWLERWMQAEEAIEIEHSLARNIDAGPHGVVLRLGVRYHDIQPIGRTPLKNHDQAPGARPRRSRAHRGASQKAWHGGGTDHGECAVTKKDATCDGHRNAPGSYLL
jgi:hypothetical protein